MGDLCPSRSEVAAEPQRDNARSLLQGRNTGKMNAFVQARHDPEAWARDGGLETEVDLMVDRLHDITSD